MYHEYIVDRPVTGQKKTAAAPELTRPWTDRDHPAPP